jgi:hypothetical protein
VQLTLLLPLLPFAAALLPGTPVVLSRRLLQVAVCNAEGALLLLWRGEDSIRKRHMVWLRLLWSLKAVLATCGRQDGAG